MGYRVRLGSLVFEWTTARLFGDSPEVVSFHRIFRVYTHTRQMRQLRRRAGLPFFSVSRWDAVRQLRLLPRCASEESAVQS